MDLKERLRQLSSLSKTPTASIENRGGEGLRERLNRLLEPRRIYQKKSIEELIEGEVVLTAHGESFQKKTFYPPEFRCGEMTLSEILHIPTYPAHLLSRDERLRGMELQKGLFLDIETTGLVGGTGTFVFMVGLGFFQENGFLIHQFFMRDYSEEKASLSLIGELLNTFQFWVTFNGKYYDLPLLETRFILSQIQTHIREMPNFDLLYPARKIWKGAYENCRLVTLESQLLGMERLEDIPSEWIPSLYFDYLQTGDARRIQKVFYHNQMDILSMVALIGRIHLVYHDPRAAKPRKGIEHFALGRLFWEHGYWERAISSFEIALKRCNDDLAWEVMRWLSMAFKKTGQVERACSLWEEMATWPYPKDNFPLVELAKYYEHRLKHYEKAAIYVDQALKRLKPDQQDEIERLLQRKRRIERKRDGSASQ